MSKIFNYKTSFIFIFIISFQQMNAQYTNEHWDNYIASYEDNHPGSTTLRMDLINHAPISGFNHILITGLSYETNRTDGFPENETFQILHQVSDELVKLIQEKTEAIYTGSFMYQKERLEYFYIKESSTLPEILDTFYKTNYPNFQYYINIKEDKEWEAYLKFLYPNQATLNFMSDEAVIHNLEIAGDKLTKARRVDYWLSFPTKNEMNTCKEELITLGFKVQSEEKSKKENLPYSLQVWRINHVDINTIHPITIQLNELANKYNGDYDGWETIIIKE